METQRESTRLREKEKKSNDFSSDNDSQFFSVSGTLGNWRACRWFFGGFICSFYFNFFARIKYVYYNMVYYTILDVLYTHIKINDKLKKRRSLGLSMYISSITCGWRIVGWRLSET